MRVCSKLTTFGGQLPYNYSTKKVHPMSQEHHVNGGDAYPPSRPGPMTFLLGAIVIVAGAVLVNWQAVSTFIHLSQIKSGLGL
jgi:hypothetical protein